MATHRIVLFAAKIPIDAPTPEGAFELAAAPFAPAEDSGASAGASTSTRAPKKRRAAVKTVARTTPPSEESKPEQEFYVYYDGTTDRVDAVEYIEDGKTYKLTQNRRFMITTEGGETQTVGLVCCTPTAVLCAVKDWAFFVTPTQACRIKTLYGCESAHKKFVVDLTGKFASEVHNECLLPRTEHQLFYIYEMGKQKRCVSFYQHLSSKTSVYRMGGYMFVRDEAWTALEGDMAILDNGAFASVDDRFQFEMTEKQTECVRKWRESVQTAKDEDTT